MFFAICLLIVIFKSQTFIQQKKIFLDKFSKGGRYEYLYLPRILFKALKHNFYPIEKMDVRIKFENIIILETTRKKAAEVGALQFLDIIPTVKGEFFFKEKNFQEI